MIVTQDLVGGSIDWGRDGPIVVRRFMVDEIEAQPSAVEYVAIKADHIPAYGDAHPTIPLVQCYNVSAEAISPSQVRIEAKYKVFTADDLVGDRVEVESGAVTSEMETNKDREGTEIFTRHTYVTTNTDGTTTEREVVQYGLVKVQVPQQYLRFTRREPTDPADWSESFIGKVNENVWREKDPRTWLCTRIEGRTTDGGESFEVNYEFQYNPETWDARVVFLDPDTKEPVAGSQEGVEIQSYEMYQSVDFSILSLGDF